MPFPFTLPTTSYVNFGDFLSSATHPSLPLAATSARAVLRDALKQHKRLPPTSQTGHLNTVVNAAEGYIPYALALESALAGSHVNGAQVDVALTKDLEIQWRCVLSSPRAGKREASRVSFKSLDVELVFVLQTLAYAHTNLAREQLRPLYVIDAVPLPPDQRAARIATAMQHLLKAQAIHSHVSLRSSSRDMSAHTQRGIADLNLGVLSALASMALADATLITVLKDDPYPTAIAAGRNSQDKDWMFKSPDMPKVRTHLFARLCIAASEHAQQALAGVRNVQGIDEDLVEYLDSLRRVARARAARFLGIDAEAQGKVGEGIGWLRGGLKEIGITVNDRSRAIKGLSKLKRQFKDKVEDRRIGGSSSEWGSDSGKADETRILEMLDKKWSKMNDTVSLISLTESYFEGRHESYGICKVFCNS